MYRIPLAVNTFGAEEREALLAVWDSGRMTQGERVAEFQRVVSRYHGMPEGVFCNSGSSANLLMVTALTNPYTRRTLRPGDEVIVPAVTWPTTVWPLVQVGAIPVFVDVDPATLAMRPEAVERATGPKTRGVLLVHLLGNPGPALELDGLCRDWGVDLLEDCCEALGAEIEGRPVGSFGRMATFSFYFSHHLTTVEGGMVVGSPPDASVMRSLRNHGMIRDLDQPLRGATEALHPALDPRFLFLTVGFNLRGTDLQAAVGLAQWAKQQGWRARRRVVASLWADAVADLPEAFVPFRFAPGANPFAFPLIVRRDGPVGRREVVERLEAGGIETRPIVAGCLTRQPALQDVPHRVSGALDGAELLHDQGLYIGIHPLMTDEDVLFVAEMIQKAAAGVAA